MPYTSTQLTQSSKQSKMARPLLECVANQRWAWGLDPGCCAGIRIHYKLNPDEIQSVSTLGWVIKSWFCHFMMSQVVGFWASVQCLPTPTSCGFEWSRIRQGAMGSACDCQETCLCMHLWAKLLWEYVWLHCKAVSKQIPSYACLLNICFYLGWRLVLFAYLCLHFEHLPAFLKTVSWSTN